MPPRPSVWLPLLLFGLAFAGMGFFLWKSDQEPELEIIRSAAVEESTSGQLVVDIEGAVANPGVYKLESGARVNDVIEAAGGFTIDADINWIDSRINRAEKVEDGYKLYVPEKNEIIGEVAGKKITNVTSINFASTAELEGLPGVGEVTAGKIIQGRPYNKLTDLIERKIVTQKVYDQIKLHIGL